MLLACEIGVEDRDTASQYLLADEVRASQCRADLGDVVGGPAVAGGGIEFAGQLVEQGARLGATHGHHVVAGPALEGGDPLLCECGVRAVPIRPTPGNRRHEDRW